MACFSTSVNTTGNRGGGDIYVQLLNNLCYANDL